MGRAQDSAVASESDTQIGELRRGYYLTKKDVIVHVGIKKKNDGCTASRYMVWKNCAATSGVKNFYAATSGIKHFLRLHERGKTPFAPLRAG